MADNDHDETSKEVTVAPCTHFIASRRAFLKGTATALAAAPLMSACEFADTYGDQTVDERVDFDVSMSQFSALSEAGGVACAEAGAVTLILLRDQNDQILAFDSTCPHANLDMTECGGTGAAQQATWNASEGVLQCNWHQSQFNTEGQYIGGVIGGGDVPNLTRFEVEFDPASGQGAVILLSQDIEDEMGETSS